MKSILVGIKSVVDANARIRVNADFSGIDAAGAKMSVNPFDEIALEEALRLKERGVVEEVIVVGIGSDDCQQQLRSGLAMGADRAIHVLTDGDVGPMVAARALTAIAVREQPIMVLLGKQAIDDDNCQTGQMLAGLWNRPQATFASKVEIDSGVARVTREVDSGLETLEVELPAVVTADIRLNEPRYVRLPDIMKAKRKPLQTVSLSELGVRQHRQVTVVRFETPARRARGIVVKDAAELVGVLKERGLL